MSEQELMDKLAALGELGEEQRNEIVCTLIGHTKIRNFFWGEWTCGRCGSRVGDSLGSVFNDAPKSVVIGHDCEVCRENYAGLDWQDKLFAPDPFAVKDEE